MPARRNWRSARVSEKPGIEVSAGMIRSSLSFLLAGALLGTVGSAETPLRIGDLFPAVSGETLAGPRLDLPIANTGKRQVLVFTFSKEAGLEARVWNEHIARDFKENPQFSKYSVIVLESVPVLFRGIALSGMKSRMASPLWNKTALLYKDEALWRNRLTVTNDNHCYIVVLDRGARVIWMGHGPFTDAGYSALKAFLGP
jgi:hypothetical protein